MFHSVDLKIETFCLHFFIPTIFVKNFMLCNIDFYLSAISITCLPSFFVICTLNQNQSVCTFCEGVTNRYINRNDWWHILSINLCRFLGNLNKISIFIFFAYSKPNSRSIKCCFWVYRTWYITSIKWISTIFTISLIKTYFTIWHVKSI